MSHYIAYYDQQTGGSIGVKNVYTGSTYQRGSGIGSFIGAIFRKIVPYLSRGAKAVGKEAVRAGLNVLDDVATEGVSFKDSINTRLRESGKNLKRKAEKKVSEMMKGHGYKSAGVKRKRQSTSSRARARNAPRRKTIKRLKKSKSDKKRKTKRRRKNKKTSRRSVTDIFGPA